MDTQPRISQWDIFEQRFEGPSEGNPFTDVRLTAEFTCGGTTVGVTGFYDGGGTYAVRFMPQATGTWRWRTSSNAASLDGRSGEFECVEPAAGVHGPVHVSETYHFSYADGTPYLPIGTTCYAWIHQTPALIAKTLKTLETTPFNKLRMCVFPKDYCYNKNEPELFAFPKKQDGTFDLMRFNPAFFAHLERCVAELGRRGVEADVILFHPYDRWGFSTMSPENDDRYLRYVISRLAAFRNVWWSLANEFDLMQAKKPEDWDRFFQIVRDSDPYGHPRSVHNCGRHYDHGRPWVTHVSAQHGSDDMTPVAKWREQFKKPVVMDECGYEGNIPQGWGYLTGQDLVRRAWLAVMHGGHAACHGDTFLDDRDELWWSKGGVLKGDSAPRFAFMREILSDANGRYNPAPRFCSWWLPALATTDESRVLLYCSLGRPGCLELKIPSNKSYTVDIIDTWHMTIMRLAGAVSGECAIPLPSQQYILVRLTAAL